MDISYFQKINNTYKSSSRQETDLYILNRHVDDCFADTIDYHIVKRNGEPFELLIIKDSDSEPWKKKIKSKHSAPFNLGDYIEWNDQIWLVTIVDVDDKTYHSGYMYLCTFPLRWQNQNGDIIERWVYVDDVSSGTGVTGNDTLTVGDNEYDIWLPIDIETKQLTRDMRFVIDFDDAQRPDVYKLTNRVVNQYNNQYFNRGGILILTLSFDVFNEDTDKFVEIDNSHSGWICNYKSISISSDDFLGNDLSYYAVINGNRELKCGFNRTYTVQFFEDSGNEIDWNTVSFMWNIVSDFEVKSQINGNQIVVSVDDDTLIGSNFTLQCKHVNNSIIGEIQVNIVEGF